MKKIKLYRTYLADLTPAAFDVYQGIDPRKPCGPVCGKTPTHGLLAGPPKPNHSSAIIFNLKGGFRKLTGSYGIGDGDGRPPASPLTFRIVGNGRTVWKSQPLQAHGVTGTFQARMEHVKKLELIVECPGDYSFCGATWIDPVLTK